MAYAPASRYAYVADGSDTLSVFMGEQWTCRPACNLFARVVETGGFTAVARESGASQPTISRTIAALEAHLGVRLLNGSSRAVTLTDDGRHFYERARGALEAVAEAEDRRGQARRAKRLATAGDAGGLRSNARGTAHSWAFLERHPQAAVELAMNDAFVDLVGEGLDLAIRVGDLVDPSLVARRVGIARRVTVAAAAYLDRYGVPSTPADLARHDCVIYTRLATGHRWHFESRDGPVQVDVHGRFRADNSEAVREAVIGGAGIAVMPVWLFQDEIERGLVRIVLVVKFEPTRLPIHAVYPSRRLLAAKVRCA